MGVLIGLIILSVVVGSFLFFICDILDSRLEDISKSLNFLAVHTHHSCEECKDERERQIEAQKK